MTSFRIRAACADDLPTLSRWLQRPVHLPVPWAPPGAAETTGSTQHAAAHQWLLVAESADPALPLRAALRLVDTVGLQQPRVSYHVGCTVHAAAELGLFHQQRTLLLGHDHTGASELADLTWARHEVPLAEQAMALRTLVKVAMQQLLAARGTGRHRLIVELPGVRDAAGQSPFWQGLGRHFFSGDPAAAAAAHGPDWRSHVASLLPRHVLYTSFLPAAADAAIAQVHESALPLREVLEDAGLRYSHHINVEDGGPILEAALDDLRP